MHTAANISQLSVGGLFPSAVEFDLAVRRYNQDKNKLIVLNRKNNTRIHHICLLQSREKFRIAKLNKGRSARDRYKPKMLCAASIDVTNVLLSLSHIRNEEPGTIE